jgi:hypothetical protein
VAMNKVVKQTMPLPVIPTKEESQDGLETHRPQRELRIETNRPQWRLGKGIVQEPA